jgi:hypothetical protein
MPVHVVGGEVVAGAERRLQEYHRPEVDEHVAAKIRSAVGDFGEGERRILPPSLSGSDVPEDLLAPALGLTGFLRALQRLLSDVGLGKA